MAIVLSGGGARGAYEAGVLSYILDEMNAGQDKQVHVDIICGTSVGAINSAALAGSMMEQRLGIRHLVHLWQELGMENVLEFSWRQAAALAGIVSSKAPRSLMNGNPMAELISREVRWKEIRRSLAMGHLRALSVTCTEVRTGRAVLFIQTGPGTSLPAHAPPRTLMRAGIIGPKHVLASASLPFVFPPVRIGSQLYVDGGLRHNTPIAPALRLGATHVLVVGSSVERGGVHEADEQSQLSGASLMGKVMNALLLDHLDNDLAQVRMLNELYATGEQAFGPSYTDKMREAAFARGSHMVEKVKTLIIRPSTTLGSICAAYLHSASIKRSNSKIVRRFLEWYDTGDEADLASYLLFEGDFAKQLIQLGRADARAQRDRLKDFFGEVENPIPNLSTSHSPSDSFGPPAVG